MKFDPQRFESLNGIDAAYYAVDIIKQGVHEEDILPYFQAEAGTMDWPRLELVLGMVGSIGTSRAMQIVSNYLDNPNFQIRFVAIKSLKKATFVDEIIMKRVVAALSQQYDNNMNKSLAQELSVILDRPANEEASRIARDFKEQHNTP